MRKDFIWRNKLVWYISNKIYPLEKIEDPFDNIGNEGREGWNRKLTEKERNWLAKYKLRNKLYSIIYCIEFVIKRLFYIGIGILIFYIFLRIKN